MGGVRGGAGGGRQRDEQEPNDGCVSHVDYRIEVNFKHLTPRGGQ